MSGDTCDFDSFVELQNKQEYGCLLNCNAIFVSKEGVAYITGMDENRLFWMNKLDYSYGIGTGSEFALSALDHGKTAIEAVRYAAKRDCYTGGRIYSYDIKSGEFSGLDSNN